MDPLSRILDNRISTSYLDTILFDGEGQLQVLPARDLADLNQDHVHLWCHRNGIYLIPSQELVSWIRSRIGSRKAIEIGSGNGALGRALGIPMFDNFMQRDFPDVVAQYQILGQPVVRYGSDVIKRNANAAVRIERPQVVVGSWITHLYKENDHARGGNMYGVDELKILEAVGAYIHVGCLEVHAKKRWISSAQIHRKEGWLFGRGKDRVVLVWEKT